MASTELASGESNFEVEVSRLQATLAMMVEHELKAHRDPNAWLQILYQHYGSRFLSDNERIWSTGTIFIPVSLAGFVALMAVEDPTCAHVTVLMIGSVLVLFIWLMIAERHRAFQQKSLAWLEAIERTINLKASGPRSLPEGHIGQAVNRISIQQWRWIFLLLVVLAWCSVLAFTLLNWL